MSGVGRSPAELHTFAVTAANQSREPAILTTPLSLSVLSEFLNGEKEKNIPPCAPPSFGDGLRLRSAAFDVNFCHMPVVLPKILSMALFPSQVSSHLLKLLPSSAKGLHQTQTVRRERESENKTETQRK